MTRRCQLCNALLSSYNPSKLCCPCSRKKQDNIEQKLLNPQIYRNDYIYGILEHTKRSPVSLISAKNRVHA